MPDNALPSHMRQAQEPRKQNRPRGGSASGLARKQSELQRYEQKRLDRYGRFGGR